MWKQDCPWCGCGQLGLSPPSRCFNEEPCITVPDAEGHVMVLQPDEPKISLSGIDHFARSAAEFEAAEGVGLFPELRIVSTITREVEPDAEGEDDPTGITRPAGWRLSPKLTCCAFIDM